ncbi:hypothetical protein E2C01_053249 [Portunus trituberculatus]|uniref:Uncharacterized protein n=1 Tax=Portunus trituberculatus TaxID=210409 RepID=A0A5B7GNT5_PORTR|nr:hypothetical protein [Portunus trituberculatus]
MSCDELNFLSGPRRPFTRRTLARRREGLQSPDTCPPCLDTRTASHPPCPGTCSLSPTSPSLPTASAHLTSPQQHSPVPSAFLSVSPLTPHQSPSLFYQHLTCLDRSRPYLTCASVSGGGGGGGGGGESDSVGCA